VNRPPLWREVPLRWEDGDPPCVWCGRYDDPGCGSSLRPCGPWDGTARDLAALYGADLDPEVCDAAEAAVDAYLRTVWL
jgi:hypothetical protein